MECIGFLKQHKHQEPVPTPYHEDMKAEHALVLQEVTKDQCRRN